MFQNDQTLWLEILVLTSTLAFVSLIIGIYIYKKVHHLPTGDCACCHTSKSLVKAYHKAYSKK